MTHLRGDGAAELADEGELVLLRVALHDGAAGPHLRHDAPSAPQINGRAVVPLPWEQEHTREGALSPAACGQCSRSPGSWGAETELSAPLCRLGRVLTEQQLWGPVPEGHHTVGVAVGLAVLGQAEGPGQPKVRQLQNPIAGDEHVSRLHVPVQDLREAQGGGFPGVP